MSLALWAATSATQAQQGGALPSPESLPKPAPEAPSSPDAKADEVITVTGSRIGRSNLEDFGHVTVVSSQDIRMSGATTVDELLRKLPSVTLQGVNKNNNNGGNGLAMVELRNLGVNRTLVLINGRRFVSAGSSNAVDLNNIPVPMIERVEVLLDGASAVYGSDAIGGVVNIILKKNFEGARVEAFGGISDQGDGEEYGVNGTVGTNFDRGNVTFNISYVGRGHIAQRDRAWAREPVVFAEFANGVNAEQGIAHTLGSSAVPEGRAGGVFFRPDPTTGLSYQPFTERDLSQRYNYGERQWLIGEMQRVTGTALASYDLTLNSRAFFEANFTHRSSRTRMAAQPLGLAGTGTFPNSFQVSVNNPYLPDDFRATLEPGTRSVLLARRMTDVGDRMTDIEADTFRLVTGVEGTIGSGLRWEAYVNYGRNRSTMSTRNSVNLARALETGDPALCAANAEKGCVVGDYFGAGELQPEVVDYIRYTDTGISGSEQISGGASIAGDLVDLWAGPLGFAAGTVARREAGYLQPSATTVAGDASGNGTDPIKGSYHVYEFFSELRLPLARGLPGAEEITLEGAARWSRFNTFGADTTLRTALSYAPVRDFRLRGVYSTAFRAPAVSELFSGSADSFASLTDPCNDWDTNPNTSPAVRANCEAAGVPRGFNQNLSGGSQIRTNVGGNPNLGAETAKVMDLGVVLTPRFHSLLAGFSATVDYYRVTVDNAISGPDPQWLLDECYGSKGLSSPACDAMNRGLNGGISRLDATAMNVGKLETSGFDMTVAYALGLGQLGLPNVGNVMLSWQGNYMLDYDETINGEKVRYGGTISTGSGTAAHFRWNANAAFSSRHWTLTSRVRFIDGARIFGVEPGSEPYDWIKPVTYLDLSAQYNINGFSMIFGVNNVTDLKPPFLQGSGQNASADTYDFAGRYFFTRLSYQM